MCEFKIIRKNNNSQIMEDVVVLYYNEDNELILKDVIGMGDTLKSALILDVNTLNQKCVILENPLVKNFVNLLVQMNNNSATTSDIDPLVKQLEVLKGELPK